MSTKTEKFDLHQWAPTDNFLREEINENFAKLDLSALKLASGSFTGTGVAGQHVILGFKPKLLILMGKYRHNNGEVEDEVTFVTEEFVVQSLPKYSLYYTPANTHILFTDDGFTAVKKNIVPVDEVKYYIVLH